MNKFAKYGLYAVGAIALISIVGKQFEAKAIKATSCLRVESVGSFKTWKNVCNDPVVAMVCRIHITGREVCATKTYVRGEELAKTASASASPLVRGLTPETKVFACISGYTPARMPNDPYDFTCNA